MGIWPDYFEGIQVAQSPETLEQFLRSVTPNTGRYDPNVIADAMSALVDRIGSAVLFTHSQGGGPGWLTVMRNEYARGIVAYEPGSGFVFPEGGVPETMLSAAGPLAAEAMSLENFKKLVRFPILIYYGDNIPSEPTERRGEDNWRVRLAMAQLWVEAINRHGGDAMLVHLPKIANGRVSLSLAPPAPGEEGDPEISGPQPVVAGGPLRLFSRDKMRDL
ncbi:hypothetical protein [Paracoccus sp. (in: a-proteobacteria)]|uniref:hypothetical protein n=1 Tax=Paracoccus sp. TaxID=267 RepID=UPI002AFF98FA|nr:hypothetical protein [Paracoccus sp. (in: a-proteobacteria)]